jgi:hypothetical protein
VGRYVRSLHAAMQKAGQGVGASTKEALDGLTKGSLAALGLTRQPEVAQAAEREQVVATGAVADVAADVAAAVVITTAPSTALEPGAKAATPPLVLEEPVAQGPEAEQARERGRLQEMKEVSALLKDAPLAKFRCMLAGDGRKCE